MKQIYTLNILLIEVTDFKSDVRFDLRDYLEAAVASEAKKSPPAISLNICRRSIRSVPCFQPSSNAGYAFINIIVNEVPI